MTRNSPIRRVATLTVALLLVGAHASFADIVLGGLRIAKGMPSFADRLDAEQTRSIQAWILQRAADSAARD